MAIASMTGFARANGQLGEIGWTWEAKSVNGRSLDLRFRLPPGFDHMEGRARALLAAAFKRGNVTAQLALARPAGPPKLAINTAFLDDLVALGARYAGRVAPGPPRLDALLAVRGVVEAAEPAPETAAEVERRDAALLDGLGEAARLLAASRAEEGARLADILQAVLAEIAALTHSARTSASAQPGAVRDRLAGQIAELLAGASPVPGDRLAQEIALLATKADVREELDRLGAHISAARALLAEGGPIGRQLDFLCQEFNREANTLCSKAAELDLTGIGLKLKAAIERLREQVQNIE